MVLLAVCRYIYQFTKHWFYWSFFLVISASVMASYVMFLMITGICLLAKGQQLYLHWCNKLAPENTQMAFEKAIEHGATGLETEVTLSYDGVPFLMHDSTLRRTTNIHEILPDFSDMPASMFTWQILETLNSGQWFFKAKPFKHMAPLTKEDEEMAKNQSIMKLSNFLRLANKENKLVIFDLYRPPKKHPYRNTWIMKVLEVMINEVGIKSQLVLWLPGQYRADVQMIAPLYRQVLGKKLPLPDLLRMGIRGLNLPYKDINSKDIKEYEKYGIFTNIYVINEPWLYSLAWCAGVHSVTTNTIQILKNIKSPFFLMTPEEYMRMWILLDLISALVIMVVFFFHWWRQKGWCELTAKKSSPVFPMSGVTGVKENIEEVQKQNKNNENQEEIPVSSSPSDKTTGEYWDSVLEMKREKVKMTRSLSTESVMGSNGEDRQDLSSVTLGDFNDDASSEKLPKYSVLSKFCCIS